MCQQHLLDPFGHVNLEQLLPPKIFSELQDNLAILLEPLVYGCICVPPDVISHGNNLLKIVNLLLQGGVFQAET
jgi:hypothetical protein